MKFSLTRPLFSRPPLPVVPTLAALLFLGAAAGCASLRTKTPEQAQGGNYAVAHSPASPSCPIPEHSETLRDCPWASLGREEFLRTETQSESGLDAAAFLTKLRAQAPQLLESWNKDRAIPELRTLWGTSINYDEYAKGIIVPPALLQLIGDQLNIPSPESSFRLPLAHAGAEHTYGYLFSLLKTPFGFKRSRWISGELDKGFGLKSDTLSALPIHGTLLSNLTFFAGRIAFHDSPRTLKILQKLEPFISPALRSYSFSKLRINRLTETLSRVGSNREQLRSIRITTDFVDFPVTANQGNSTLLIYSVLDSTLEHPVLITAFPVDSKFAARALDPAALGEQKPINTRYNAFVNGVTDSLFPLMGERQKTEVQL
jgi:hypothetical protein